MTFIWRPDRLMNILCVFKLFLFPGKPKSADSHNADKPNLNKNNYNKQQSFILFVVKAFNLYVLKTPDN